MSCFAAGNINKPLKSKFMDRSFNRIELRGNAGQDARIMKVGDNTVARFNIATNETYKDRSGNLRRKPHGIRLQPGAERVCLILPA